MERIAHRGAKLELPENSLPAFVRAFERGANAVELDVHATRDGVVVVHHDPTFGSVSRKLFGRSIADVEWKDVRQVELAPGVGIPTLDDVFRSLPATARVYVEIKGRAIEHLVAGVLEGRTNQCAVHSFDHEAVGRMRALAPVIRRGILLDRGYVDVEGTMRAVGARDVWPEWTVIDQDLVDRVHGAGGRVIAWTVDTQSTADRLIVLGVDGLCTDDVRLLDGLCG